MRNLIYLILIVSAIAFFYPAKPASTLYKVQTSLKSIGKSDADIREELMYKRQELAAYENAIVEITTNFEREVENAPICPTTGRKAITTMIDDPRGELEDKCEALREEILQMEASLKG